HPPRTPASPPGARLPRSGSGRYVPGTRGLQSGSRRSTRSSPLRPGHTRAGSWCPRVLPPGRPAWRRSGPPACLRRETSPARNRRNPVPSGVAAGTPRPRAVHRRQVLPAASLRSQGLPPDRTPGPTMAPSTRPAGFPARCKAPLGSPGSSFLTLHFSEHIIVPHGREMVLAIAVRARMTIDDGRDRIHVLSPGPFVRLQVQVVLRPEVDGGCDGVLRLHQQVGILQEVHAVIPPGGIPGVLQRLVVAPASGLQQPATTERPPVTARHVPVAEAVGVRAVGDRLLVGCLDHAPVRIFDAPISLRLLRV